MNGVAVVLAAVFVATTTALPGRGVDAEVPEDDAAAVRISAARSQEMADDNSAVAEELRLFEYERAAACREVAGRWTMGLPGGGCPAGSDAAGTVDACEGDTIVMPMWRRDRATPAAPWGPWAQIDSGGCGADLLPVLSAEDFRRLPIPAPVLNVQPAADWVLVNKETIVYTDPSPVSLTTDLLGYQVTVEATPTRFTYDFGDGGRPLVTTDPGAPYPAFETFHVYRSLGTRTISLTTEWSGRYQVAGSPVWRDVDGTAETTARSAPFEVVERTSKLVAELCTAVATPPDC